MDMNKRYICAQVKIPLYIFTLIILVHSCISGDNNHQTKHSHIPVDLNKNKIELSSLFKDIKPIILETSDEALIDMMPLVKFTNTHIFIRSDNSIKIFDFEGRFVKSINKYGAGPEEYTGISDFNVDRKKNHLEILDKSKKKIMTYNTDGDYIQETPLDFWALKMIRNNMDGNIYTYSGYERDEDNINKFNIINNKKRHGFNEIDMNKSSFLHISNRINFYETSDNDILFFEPFNDTIFTVNSLGLKPRYTLSFNNGKGNIPNSFYSGNQFSNVFEFFQEFNKHNYVNSTYNVIETDDRLIFYCLNNGSKYLVIHDKAKQITNSYTRIVDDIFTDNIDLPFDDDAFILFAEKGVVMFLLEPSWFINNRNAIVNHQYNSLLQNLDEEDNPVLIMAKLK